MHWNCIINANFLCWLPTCTKFRTYAGIFLKKFHRIFFLTPILFKALGVFGLCQIVAFIDYIRSKLSKQDFETLYTFLLYSVGILGISVFGILTFSGKISPWTGRFYSLLDPSYAKNHIPIIASVSEHQPTSWSSFYFDLQILVFLFPAGLYFCFKQLTDANIFMILYGVTSIYFAVIFLSNLINWKYSNCAQNYVFAGCYGPFDARLSTNNVYFKRHHRIPFTNKIYEKNGNPKIIRL